MKKVKITLNPGSSGKKFYLFPSGEALYVWLCALERNETVQVPGIDELLLEPDGFMEVELRGFEYVYDDDHGFRRLDLIRLGKAEQPRNASGLLVTTHEGWVSGGLLPMKSYSDQDITVELLEPSVARIDLPTLFKDEVIDDASIEVEFEADEEK